MFSHIRGGSARGAGRPAPAATTWLAWLLPVFAWAPLTYPGFFQFLNGYSSVFNLDDFARSSAPMSWAPSIGQAYDLLRSEGRLPYALAALPRSLGLDNGSAVKLVMAAALLAGAVGVFGWARRRLGDWPALLASSVYAFWPFALASVYVRGAFAETVLLGMLPFAWWSADAAGAPERGRPAAVALAFVLAAAFWTQAGLALWLAAALLLYLLAGPRARRPLALAAWLVGFAGGLLGLLPVVLAHGTGGRSYVDFSGNFLNLSQVITPGWSLAASPAAVAPVSLGLAGCALAALGVLLYRERADSDLAIQDRPDSDWRDPGPPDSNRPDPDRTGTLQNADLPVWFACACVLAPVALSLGLAAPFWRLPLIARSLTYPWQLLLLAGPWLAWLAGLGGLALARLLPVPADRQSPVAGRQATIALFAPLIVLALLAVYAGLDPAAISGPVSDRPVAVFGDNQIALVSAVISDTLAAGGSATVRVQWQALRPLDQDYTVFFHAEAPDGTVYGQQDTMPRAGKAPTSGWQPGAVISDTYTLSLKPGAPAPSRYVLGLYQWQTGERLGAGSENQVVLNGK